MKRLWERTRDGVWEDLRGGCGRAPGKMLGSGGDPGGAYSLGAHGAGLVPRARGPATYRPGAARGCRSPDESLCHSSHHHRPPGLRVPTGGGPHAAAVHPALVCDTSSPPCPLPQPEWGLCRAGGAGLTRSQACVRPRMPVLAHRLPNPRSTHHHPPPRPHCPPQMPIMPRPSQLTACRSPPRQVHIPQEYQGQRGEGLSLPRHLHDDRRQSRGRRAGRGRRAQREGAGAGLGRPLT